MSGRLCGRQKLSYWETLYSDIKAGRLGDRGPGDGWLKRYEALIAPGARALDLGCGDGPNIRPLLDMGARVTAADLSQSAVELAKQAYPQIETACLDMTQGLPFDDHSFDVVAADLSLHYFTWADTQRIAADIARVLTPGGWLLARVHSTADVDPAGLERIEPNYYISRGYPRRYFDMDDLRALFGGWTRLEARETRISRYGMDKQVIEFAAKANEAG